MSECSNCDHIRLMLKAIAGLYIGGAKFPFNWFFPSGGEVKRKKVLQASLWGLRSNDDEIKSVLYRVDTPGRESHDLTALPISLFRWAFKHWENKHPDGPTLGAWFVKAVGFLMLFPWLVIIAIMIMIAPWWVNLAFLVFLASVIIMVV
jgi:hypothetical protein